MPSPRYSLVAYVRSQLGEFVESLRRELHPDLPHLAAHLTILPPRTLQGSESSALAVLEERCAQAEPFAVELGEVKTFCPLTPTVYIRVERAARMCELHDLLNTQALSFREEWPYIPHLTIVKLAAEQPAQEAYKTATDRWAHYSGSRRIAIEGLTFVREEAPNHWADVAPVPLGRKLVSR